MNTDTQDLQDKILSDTEKTKDLVDKLGEFCEANGIKGVMILNCPETENTVIYSSMSFYDSATLSAKLYRHFKSQVENDMQI